MSNKVATFVAKFSQIEYVRDERLILIDLDPSFLPLFRLSFCATSNIKSDRNGLLLRLAGFDFSLDVFRNAFL